MSQTLLDKLRRLIDVSLLEIYTNLAGKSVGRIRMVFQEFLIPRDCTIEITFAIECSRLS